MKDSIRNRRCVIGVLALQGDVREHLDAVRRCGVEAVPVRRAEEFEKIDGLIIPGGESTAMSKLLTAFNLYEPLKAVLLAGLPVYGSCAGMIMLAEKVTESRADFKALSAIPMTVRRNAFGRQRDSFEAELNFRGVGAVSAVFIRAPWVESVGAEVEVLATIDDPFDGSDHIVAVKYGSAMATSFHPEVTGDYRIHQYFINLVLKHSRV